MERFPLFDGPVSERTFLIGEPGGTEGIDPHEIGAVYLAEPAPPVSGVRGILLGLHGSGRAAGSYRDVPFYRYQRDRAIRSGFIFAAISNGASGWGVDEGLERVAALLRLLVGEHGPDVPIIPWATSAGGVMMFRLIASLASSGIAAPIRRAIATFPVYDLFSVFETSKGCAKAWGAETFEHLVAIVAHRNPASFAERLAGCRFWIGYGDADTVVDPQANAVRFARDMEAEGSRVILHRGPGGHSTENRLVYDDDAIARFLEEEG